MDSHYQTLVETVSGIIYALDEKGHFAYVSESVESILGYKKDELIGLHFSNILHPEDAVIVSRDMILPSFSGISTGNEKAPKLFDERRTPPRKTSGLKLRVLPKKKSYLRDKPISCQVNSAGQYIFGNDGKQRFAGTVGIIFEFLSEDSSGINLNNRKKYNPFELLIQAMRHTFSNVFTGIYGNLQLIEMQMNQNISFKPNIEIIKHSVENAMSIIKQLSVIASSSESVLKKQATSTAGFVKEISEEIFAGRDAILEFKTHHNLYKFELDPDYTRHILRSILFLVREVVMPGSTVRIEILNAERVPDEIPRLDCKYIIIKMNITELDRNVHSRSLVPELDRVASSSLSYLLLKKAGGIVRHASDNCIELYLPAIDQ
jgi:hypothetical protein